MTTTKPKEITMLDLLEIANQISLTAITLHEKCDASGEAVLIPAIAVSKKYPEFKNFGKTAIFKIRKGQDDDTYYCDTLSVYRDSDGSVKVYDVDLDPLTVEYTFTSFKTGLGGFTIINVNDTQFKLGISVDEKHLSEIVKSKTAIKTGEGIPPSEAVKLLPQPITTLYSEAVKTDTIYTIISENGKTQDFDTQLLTVQCEDGKILKRLTANSELSKIFTTHGIGSKFKVVSKKHRLNKDGEIFDSSTGKTLAQWEKAKKTGKVSGEFKPQWKVKILDLQLDDFSDLDF